MCRGDGIAQQACGAVRPRGPSGMHEVKRAIAPPVAAPHLQPQLARERLRQLGHSRKTVQ